MASETGPQRLVPSVMFYSSLPGGPKGVLSCLAIEVHVGLQTHELRGYGMPVLGCLLQARPRGLSTPHTPALGFSN